MPARVLVSPRAVLTVVLGVLFLTFVDTTIVSVTLGNLEHDLSPGVVPLQWVINAYALAFAALMLAGGALADRYGRARLMALGVGAFCAGALVCALAPDTAAIITGRAVMGVGAAAAEPATLSVIRVLFPDRAPRVRALGAWSAVSGLALALGPVLGGLLVGAGSWRSVFWFSLALGAVLLAAVVAFVPDSRDPQAQRLDVAGVLVVTAGLVCAVYGAISGEYRGYTTSWVVALLVIGAALLVAFVLMELFGPRRNAPLLDLRLLRAPLTGAALLAAFAVYFGVFAVFFLTALYLDIGLNYSGARLAGMFAPMAAAIVIAGLGTGRWLARHAPGPAMAAGCIVAAAGMLLARAVFGGGVTPSFGPLTASLAVAGLGFGITVVPVTSAVLARVPSRRAGMAASATNTARQLGAVAGVTALGAVINAHLVDGVRALGPIGASILPELETGGGGSGLGAFTIPASVLRTFVAGLRLGLLVAAILVLVAAAVATAAALRDTDTDTDGAAGGNAAQPTSTAATSAGSAPPSTSSSGSA